MTETGDSWVAASAEAAPAGGGFVEGRLAEVRGRAFRARERIVRMATSGGCFIGSALSAVDLLAWLYTGVLNAAPDRRHDRDRDRLLLSKGHAVPALYAVLAEAGFFHPERLSAHLTIRDSIYWHPNAAIPGVEFHSGSLGHLLSVGAGLAIDAKLRGSASRVFVLMGDGELNEGSIWEACMIAAAQRLTNLIAIVDRNGLQANAATEELSPLEPLAAKFQSFGWATATIDGHSFEEMRKVFDAIPLGASGPSVVIANTVRGKGIASLENRVDAWFGDFEPAEIDRLLSELRAQAAGPRGRDF